MDVSIFSPLWFVNRVVDLIFVVDMCFCFCMAFHTSAKKGGKLEKRLHKIQINYVQTW